MAFLSRPALSIVLLAVCRRLDAFDNKLAGVSGRSGNTNETAGDALLVDVGVPFLLEDIISNRSCKCS